MYSQKTAFAMIDENYNRRYDAAVALATNGRMSQKQLTDYIAKIRNERDAALEEES